MMDMVLERLQTLQAEIAAIDPSRELEVTDKVAAIAAALRDALAGLDEEGHRQAVAPDPASRRFG